MARLKCFAVIVTILGFFGCGDVSSIPTHPTIAVCGYTFSPPMVAVSSLPQRVVVQVMAGNSCPWVATATDSWVHISYQGMNGTGDLILNLDPNQCKSVARTGQIRIKGTSNVLEIVQDGSDLGICP